MKRATIASFAALLCTTAAFADSKPSAEEATKITEALKAWGCSGGEFEKETEATSLYEIDDSKCANGQYDVKLDKNFNVIAITRD